MRAQSEVWAMKILKKTAAFAIAFVAIFILCACNLSVDYYYENDGDKVYYTYSVDMGRSLVSKLDASSQKKNADGSLWTVTSYFTRLAFMYGYDFSASPNANGYTYVFSRAVPVGELTGGGDEETDDNFSYRVEKGFYYDKVVCTQGNPFNGLYTEYVSGNVTQGTVLDVIVHGGGPLPGFTEVFPAAQQESLDGIKLNFYWRAGGINAENGVKVEKDGKSWYLWEAAFDAEERDIVYSYSVVNPLGWYVTITLLGALVVGIVYLCTIKSKAKPSFEKLQRGRVRYAPKGSATSNSGIKYGPENFDIYSEKEDIDMLRRRLDDVYGDPDPSQRARRELEDIFDGRSGGDYPDPFGENTKDKNDKNDDGNNKP